MKRFWQVHLTTKPQVGTELARPLYEIGISVWCHLGPVWKHLSIQITFMILEKLRNDSQMNQVLGIRVFCHSRSQARCKLANQTLDLGGLRIGCQVEEVVVALLFLRERFD